MIYRCHGTERATGKAPFAIAYMVSFFLTRTRTDALSSNSDAYAYVLNELNGHPFNTKHTFLIKRYRKLCRFSFSWDPKGEYFSIVSCSDPNLCSPGLGVIIKTDVSFYRLDHSKNSFKLPREDF